MSEDRFRDPKPQLEFDRDKIELHTTEGNLVGTFVDNGVDYIERALEILVQEANNGIFGGSIGIVHEIHVFEILTIGCVGISRVVLEIINGCHRLTYGRVVGIYLYTSTMRK